MIDMEETVDQRTLLGTLPDGSPADFDGFRSHYMSPDADGRLEYNWPPNDGAVPGSTRTATAATYREVFGSDVFTRAGDPRGGYAAPINNGRYYSFEQTSTRPQTLFEDFHHYRFTESADEIMSQKGYTMKVEQVADALGRPGGAMQMRWVKENGRRVSLETLEIEGVVEEVVLK